MGARTTLASLSLLGLVTFTGTAFAADPDPLLEKVAALEKQVDTDTTAKANDALVGDVKSATALYKDADGKDALRDRVLALVGGITKVRVDAVAKAALLALGEIGDLRGAKYVRALLRPVDEGKTPVAIETAIQVAKKLPDSSLVEPLLDIVDTSKNVDAAAKAIDALGYFGAVKSKREKILVELCKSVARNLPGGKSHSQGNVGNTSAGSGPGGVAGGAGGGSTDPGTGTTGTAGQGASARWPALSAALPPALNKLTGTVCASAQDWFAMVKDHKSTLKTLFVNDDAAPPTPDAPK